MGTHGAARLVSEVDTDVLNNLIERLENAVHGVRQWPEYMSPKTAGEYMELSADYMTRVMTKKVKFSQDEGGIRFWRRDLDQYMIRHKKIKSVVAGR